MKRVKMLIMADESICMLSVAI